MTRWTVYKGEHHWVAVREWHAMPFATWDEAFRYAYLHAVAAIHEVP